MFCSYMYIIICKEFPVLVINMHVNVYILNGFIKNFEKKINK